MAGTNRCLNCTAELSGPFCSACGQRAVPAYPTVRELVGDAWRELTGYDGRIVATLKGLMHPGFLTRDYLEGHRKRYLPPVRVYLFASVAYFLVAAAAPNLRPDSGNLIDGPGGIQIDIGKANRQGQLLTPEDREELRAQLSRAPWMVKPILEAAVNDPEGFRNRLLTTMPRVFFALLPVFAAILAMFYRRRRFTTHLVFAVHIHSFAFVVLVLSEISKFTYSLPLAMTVGVTVAIVQVIYFLAAFRAVYLESWSRTIAKAIGIAIVYAIAAVPAFAVILTWAALN